MHIYRRMLFLSIYVQSALMRFFVLFQDCDSAQS